MKYYKNLYISEGLEKKKEKVIKRIDAGKIQLGLYLILLPECAHNQLEIVSSKYLRQPGYPKKDRFVVGIAKSYDEAVDMIEDLTKTVYTDTGDVKIRDYILAKERED